METVPVVLRAMEFQVPKNKAKRFSKENSPKYLSSFLGLSSSCFLPHPESSGRAGRRSRDSWLRGQGWVVRVAFQGLRKTGRSPASRAHPELRLPVGNWDLEGGSGMQGGHESGSALSASLGDVLFGNSNIWDEQTHPSGSALSLKVTRWRPKAPFAFGKVVEVGNAAAASPHPPPPFSVF